MGHNGGRVQLNFNFLSGGNEFPFINHLKSSGGWSLVSVGGSPAASDLNANGYAISGGGVQTVFSIPSQADRPGNWIVDWVGTIPSLIGTFSRTTISFVSPTNGRWVFTPTGTPTDGVLSILLGMNSYDAGDPVTSFRMYHEDDEELLNAGEVWSPYFKSRIREVGAGVIRFLDQGFYNTNQCGKWEHRTPVDYVMYGGGVWRPEYYAGTTSNVGDAYTVSYPAGITLADKVLIQLNWNATSSGTSPTLNGISIVNMAGDALNSSTKPLISQKWTLIYDAELNQWLGQSGGLLSGVPQELKVILANDVGAHVWDHVPFYACDPPGDWAQSQSIMYRDGLESGLIEIKEPGNEVWNIGVGFPGSRYAQKKATARWGVADTHNWYGMVCSRIGEIVSDVYSGDRSRYRMVCGVQSSSYLNATASNARIQSTRWVAEGGGNAPASDWVTDGSVTTYFNALATASEETDLAYQWQVASAAGRLTIADSYAVTYDTAPPYVAWKTFFENNGVDGLLAYEGSWSQDYFSAIGDMSATITGITKGATTAITISSGSIHPVAGLWAWIVNVVGMTEINVLYAPILSVVGNVVTVDIDSTGFSNYTSGGSIFLAFVVPITGITKASQAIITTDATFGNVPRTGWFAQCVGVAGMTQINDNFKSGTRLSASSFQIGINSTAFSTYTGGGHLLYNISSIRTDLREASLGSDNVRSMEYTNCQAFVDSGGEFPSLFDLSGKNNVWSALQPTIYAADSPKWVGFKLFGTRRRRVRLTATA